MPDWMASPPTYGPDHQRLPTPPPLAGSLRRHTAPSSHALGGACLLSPVATARRLGTIKLWNGHRPHADRSIVRGTPSAPTLHGGTVGLTAHLSKSHEPSDSEPFLLCVSEESELASQSRCQERSERARRFWFGRSLMWMARRMGLLRSSASSSHTSRTARRSASPAMGKS